MPNNAHVTLVGTVMQEPKNSQTSTNQTWLKINLAVQTTKKDPNPKNPKYPYLSDFYNVNVYGKQAENLMDKVKSGSKLVVIGEMYMGEPWQDRQQQTHITPTVTANNITIVSSGNTNRTYNNSNTNNNTQPETEEEAPF
jgi:single stranded DNA-binding protein